MTRLSEIIRHLDIHIDAYRDIDITKVLSIDDSQSFDEHTLSWVSPRRMAALENINSGVIICANSDLIRAKAGVILLDVENPRFAFLKVLAKFFTPKEDTVISNSSRIHEKAEIGLNCSIGHNVVIEEGCKLSSNIRIGHNTVIKSRTIIHDDVVIGSNCTIGGVGFGYEPDEAGSYIQIPHIGNVCIESNVEIGNNVCIDRAVLGSTLLQRNVKVDNLVHIAHGVNIGRNSLIIANAMIAGSAVIGENTWISPSANILNKKRIGSHSVVGMGAVVLKDVESKTVVAGIPAKTIKKLD